MSTLLTPAVSPVELLRNILLQSTVVMSEAVAVVVGPAESSVLNEGAVRLVPAGGPPENYLPLRNDRINFACHHKEAAKADRLFNVVYSAIHQGGRRVVSDDEGHYWLVHETLVVAGPSLSISPGEELWMVSGLISIKVGTEEVTRPE